MDALFIYKTKWFLVQMFGFIFRHHGSHMAMSFYTNFMELFGESPWPFWWLMKNQAQSVEFEAIRCVVRTMPEGAAACHVCQGWSPRRFLVLGDPLKASEFLGKLWIFIEIAKFLWTSLQ